MRKINVLISIAILMGIVLTACQPVPSDPEVIVHTQIVEGEVVEVFVTAEPETGPRTFVSVSYEGARQEPHRLFLADPMEDRHEDVTVWLVGGITADVSAQIRAQRGASPYDVIPMDVPRAIEAKQEGWILDLDYDQIPNYDQIYPEFQAECEGHGVPATASTIGLMYDPDVVPHPESLLDLWNEEYQGKIAIPTPASNLGFGFLILVAIAHGGDESNLDVAFDALDQLDFIAAPNPGAASLMLERGEVGLAVAWNNQPGILVDKGIDVEFTMPAPGGATVMSCFNIINGSTNLDLAYEWLNEVLSEEYQKEALNKPWLFAPTNMNVDIPEDVSDWLPGVDVIPTLISIDWETAIPFREEALDRFIRQYGQ